MPASFQDWKRHPHRAASAIDLFAEIRDLTKAIRGTAGRPAFPMQHEATRNLLLVRNEGSRSLQIIGDLAADGARMMPGSCVEIDIAAFAGPVQITFCDGGIHLDCAPESSRIDSAEGGAITP